MPGALRKCPSNVGNEWYSREEVIADVEVEGCQFGLNVDQSFRRDEHRQAIAIEPQEGSPIFPGNERSQRLVRMEEVAAAHVSGRRLYAKIAHGAEHAVSLICDMPIGNTSCSSANRERHSRKLAHRLRKRDRIAVGI